MNNSTKFSHFIAVKDDRKQIRIGAFGNNTWKELKYIDITFNEDGNIEIKYYDYKTLGEEIRVDYSKNYNEVFEGIESVDVFLNKCGKCINENKSTKYVCNDCLLVPNEIKEKLFENRYKPVGVLVGALKR